MNGDVEQWSLTDLLPQDAVTERKQVKCPALFSSASPLGRLIGQAIAGTNSG